MLIDNHDSFTGNLAHQIARVSGVVPDIIANDGPWPGLDGYDAVFVSPGPGTPAHPPDVGHSMRVFDHDIPVFGVCLGMQALVQHAGGRVVRTNPMHGRLSEVTHTGSSVFEGLAEPTLVVRYHSLSVTDLPDNLEALAWSDEVCMAVRHRTRPHVGVQFHPESLLTVDGDRIVMNFLTFAGITPRVLPPRPPRPDRDSPQLWVRELPPADAEAMFCAHFADAENAFWLDAPTGGRHIMGDDRGPTSTRHRWGLDAFERIEAIQSGRSVRPIPETPVQPGLFGYLGYELKASCPDGAGDPIHPSPTPHAQFIDAGRLVIVEPERTLLVARPHPDNRRWMADVAAQWPPPPPESSRSVDVSAVRPHQDRATYQRCIRRAQEAIRAGETYEVCLTQQLDVDIAFRPLDAYRALRRANPAPYAAFLRFGDLAVCSSSPERFLAIDPDGNAEARPIKGTTARGSSPGDDLARAQRLASSEKERAENLMIVDLLRNDLSRVCEVGSVRVPELFAVESYATVHQLVSAVTGRLRSDVSPVEAVRAAFPGGSMTGAPKRRTMQKIHELEGRARGVYSGAIGRFSDDGAVDLSIAIRALVMQPHGATVGAGGAITALSDPVAETDEMELKARAVLDGWILPAPCGS